MKKTTVISAIAAGALSIAAAAVVSPFAATVATVKGTTVSAAVTGSPAVVEDLVTVTVLSDILKPVLGALVSITDPNGEKVLVADRNGQTPWVAVDLASPPEVLLAEQAVAGGLAIGLRKTIQLISHTLPTDTLGENWISLTQPIAEPVVIGASAGSTNQHVLAGGMTQVYPGDERYPLWSLATKTDTTLRVSANVAPLIDGGVISEFLGYKGVIAPDPGPYTRGVTLALPGVQLGQDGFYVALQLLGDLGFGVAVDVINISPTPNLVPIGPSLSAETVIYQPGQTLVVRVAGAVRKGHLSILVRPTTSGSAAVENVVVVLDSSPTIVVPANGGGSGGSVMNDCPGCERDLAVLARANANIKSSVASGAFEPTSIRVSNYPITLCEPDEPEDDSPCDIAVPGYGNCPVTATSDVECVTNVTKGPRHCKPFGASMDRTTTKTTKWKASFELSAEGAIGAGSIGTSGGFVYGRESQTVDHEGYEFQPGDHNLGQCIRNWVLDKVCAQSFTTKVGALIVLDHDGWTLDWEPCHAPKNLPKGVCTDVTDATTACSITP